MEKPDFIMDLPELPKVETTLNTAPNKKPVLPPIKEITPVAKPVAPLAKPVAPLAKPVAPLAKPVAPLAKPVAPLAKPIEIQQQQPRQQPTQQQHMEVIYDPLPTELLSWIEPQPKKAKHFALRFAEDEERLRQRIQRTEPPITVVFSKNIKTKYGKSIPDVTIVKQDSNNKTVIGKVHFLLYDKRDEHNQRRWYVKLFFYEFSDPAMLQSVKSSMVSFFKEAKGPSKHTVNKNRVNKPIVNDSRKKLIHRPAQTKRNLQQTKRSLWQTKRSLWQTKRNPRHVA
jgi:hypothetical protein